MTSWKRLWWVRQERVQLVVCTVKEVDVYLNASNSIWSCTLKLEGALENENLHQGLAIQC